MLGRETREQSGWRTPSRTMCVHGRLVDDEWGADGQRTGRLICRECGAVLSVAEARNVALSPRDETVPARARP
jgi:hypothetical protein